MKGPRGCTTFRPDDLEQTPGRPTLASYAILETTISFKYYSRIVCGLRWTHCRSFCDVGDGTVVSRICQNLRGEAVRSVIDSKGSMGCIVVYKKQEVKKTCC